MFERMTGYSLEELRKMVKGARSLKCGGASGCGCSCYCELPIGAVLNEIGVIFLEGNQEAEPDLAKIMQESDPMVAATGYFYLTQKRAGLKKETLSLMEAFEKDPKNARVIEKVNNKIEELAGNPMEA